MLSNSLRSFLRNVLPHVDQRGQNVTDSVFLCIEDHPAFLEQYHMFRRTNGSRAVNPIIGKLVREMNGLQNTGQAKSKSTLIKKYTTH